jgi:hypothetical protein
LIPAAVLGVFRLMHWALRRLEIAVFLTGLVGLLLLPQQALEL